MHWEFLVYAVSALITCGQITSLCCNTLGRGPAEEDKCKFPSKGRRIRSSWKICREVPCICIKSREIHMDTCPSAQLLLLLARHVPQWSVLNTNRIVACGDLSILSLLFPVWWNRSEHKAFSRKGKNRKKKLKKKKNFSQHSFKNKRNHIICLTL